MSGKDRAVELRQELIAILQSIRFQRGSLLQQSHVLPCGLDDVPDLVKDSLLPSGVFLKITETAAAVDSAQRFPVMRNVDVSGL